MAPATENVEMQAGAQAAMPAVSEVAAAPAPRVKPTEYVAYPDSMKKAKPTEVVCYPTQPAEAPAAAAAAPVIAPIDLGSSGLTLIETDPNKAASVAPAPESREHAPRRRQRPREIYTIENNEPLQQVETHSPS